MPSPLLVTFVGRSSGPWRVDHSVVITGEPLVNAERLFVIEGAETGGTLGGAWALKGFTSNARYAHRPEVAAMALRQEGLCRPEATCAALIPIRKTEAWWALAQDQRRTIIEEDSRHISIGMAYLPAIARRLHHSRDLGEPFDFLTWFEYAPEHNPAFEEMVRRLRETEEWRYVDREVDIRLSRSDR